MTSEDVGALSTSGGTLLGDLGVEKTSMPTINLKTKQSSVQIYKNASDSADFGTSIRDCHGTDVEQNSVALSLSHKQIIDDNFTRCLTLSKVENGVGSYYAVYGEHNASELGVARIANGYYVGSGTGTVTINYDRPPKLLILSTAEASYTGGGNGTLIAINGQTKVAMIADPDTSSGIYVTLTWNPTNVVITNSKGYIDKSGYTYLYSLIM